jgi:hypothetical protein
MARQSLKITVKVAKRHGNAPVRSGQVLKG